MISFWRKEVLKAGQRTKHAGLLVIVSAVAVVALCIFIFGMSARDAGNSGSLSRAFVRFIVHFVVPGYDQMTLAEQLHWQDVLHLPVRKLAHFSEYALLGILSLNLRYQIACMRNEPVTVRSIAFIWAAATVYAVTDEIHQLFIPGRSCQFTDVCIDSAGVLFGLALAIAIARLVSRRKRNRVDA